MKRFFVLFISFTFIVTSFAQENKLSNLKLTGNLIYDSKAIESEIKLDPKLILLQDENKKLPLLAGLFSAVLPGSGEFYSESYLKAAIFFIIEVSAITANILWNKKGDDLTTEFKNYANAHWSPVRYADWLNRFSAELGAEGAITININPDVTKKPWERVDFKQINQVEELVKTFSHRLIPWDEQQYYELIGKYRQYNHGWDYWDTHESTAEYFNNIPQQMLDYAAMHIKPDETYYKYATTAVIVIVINHVLSAIDAVWTTNRYNKNLAVNLDLKRFDNLWAIDYYPQLNIKFRL